MNLRNTIGRLTITFLSCLIPFQASGFASLVLAFFGFAPRISQIYFRNKKEKNDKTKFVKAVINRDHKKVIEIFETSKKNGRPIDPNEEIVPQHYYGYLWKTSPLVFLASKTDQELLTRKSILTAQALINTCGASPVRSVETFFFIRSFCFRSFPKSGRCFSRISTPISEAIDNGQFELVQFLASYEKVREEIDGQGLVVGELPMTSAIRKFVCAHGAYENSLGNLLFKYRANDEQNPPEKKILTFLIKKKAAFNRQQLLNLYDIDCGPHSDYLKFVREVIEQKQWQNKLKNKKLLSNVRIKW